MMYFRTKLDIGFSDRSRGVELLTFSLPLCGRAKKCGTFSPPLCGRARARALFKSAVILMVLWGN